MTNTDPLALWEATAQDLLAVLHDLSEDEWERPALPGWRVRDVLAHLAHLESEAAGLEQPEGGRVDVETQAGRSMPMPVAVTEAGVAARRDRSVQDLLEEFERACVARDDALAKLDLSDPKAPAPGLVGALGWDLRTWLRNRPTDLWVHEQDIRRATGRPMVTTSVGAAHVAGIMAAAFPIALRKLPVGTSAVAHVTGPQGRVLSARVGDDGRGAPFDPSDGTDVALELSDETWLLLTGGRIAPEDAQVAVTGDAEVAATVLRQINVTP